MAPYSTSQMPSCSNFSSGLFLLSVLLLSPGTVAERASVQEGKSLATDGPAIGNLEEAKEPETFEMSARYFGVVSEMKTPYLRYNKESPIFYNVKFTLFDQYIHTEPVKYTFSNVRGTGGYFQCFVQKAESGLFWSKSCDDGRPMDDMSTNKYKEFAKVKQHGGEVQLCCRVPSPQIQHQIPSIA